MEYSNKKIGNIFQEFSTSSQGLSESQANKRREEYGKNILPEKKRSRLKMLLLQFHNPLIYILFVAVIISVLVPYFQNGTLIGHDLIEPIAIFVILFLNAFFGFFQELKAENTLQALKRMQPAIATVIRNGNKIQIQREDVVPGDIISLAEGDRIPADARIIESVQAKVIESALTGESEAVQKDERWIGTGSIGDQKNMVFSSTQLAVGRLDAVVVATGIHTQIGRIAALVSESTSPKTPLEKKLERLGKKIGLVVIALCFFIFILVSLRGGSPMEALITAVALAVSAVPEGLPAVMTISLAVGVGIMAKKKALVRELRAVETLGSVTVIASDKTGTITQNKMHVVEIYSEGSKLTKNDLSRLGKHPNTRRMLEVATSCNDAVLPSIGDPTELALLEIAELNGVGGHIRIGEVPFNSESKWMSTTHKISGKKIEFIKGAPEVVSGFCPKDKQKGIQDAANQMAREGLRTIAVAMREKGKKDAVFLGIFGLLDPPRKTAAIAIRKAKEAGIRTIMITGDHAITAATIAKKVGIPGKVVTGAEIELMDGRELSKLVDKVNIFARVSPEHKVRICKALQENGEIVAMTGDGVNDAPALHQAEVGISMGIVGTSVARQSSDLVLLNDHYATIVTGVEEGRRIFSNIKKSVSFLLRTNFDELFLIVLASILAMPLPMLPIHILFLNLLTDSFPAIALSMETAEEDTMKKKPRPANEGFLSGQFRYIFILGGLASLMELAIFSFSIDRIGLNASQTLILALSVAVEFVIIFSVRTNLPLFRKKHIISKNPWVFRSVLFGTVVFFIALLTPLHKVLSLTVFPPIYWIFPVLAALVIFTASEIIKTYSLKSEKA